ncbi:hypothetical protein [Variovorax paradoxus]|uniref:Lipoprotein n=1 Tax=Variovorax paradoxus (strain EPS) TaxID=595537 RepID=E6UVM0_VARPE|nr:hypothetical protein [Variovorax paradoxus]ADU35253.1 hypothetical protein Varpa_1035 [Variovorax paradoxus EPS]
MSMSVSALSRIVLLACLSSGISGCSTLGAVGGIGVGPGVSLDPRYKPQAKAAPQTAYRIDAKRYFIVEPYANTSCKDVSLGYSARTYSYSRFDAKKFGMPEVNHAVVATSYEPAPGSLSADASSKLLLAPPVLDESYPQYFFVPFSANDGERWGDLVLLRSGKDARLDLVQRGTSLYFDHDRRVIDLAQIPFARSHREPRPGGVVLTPSRAVDPHENLPPQGQPSLDTQAVCTPRDLPFVKAKGN